MNKLKKQLGAYVSAMLLLTGCAGKGTLEQFSPPESDTNIGSESTVSSQSPAAETEYELMPVTDAAADFDGAAERVRNREFDNIDFTNAYFSFPEVTEFHTLEYNELVSGLSWQPDDVYDYLCRRIDELFPGAYNDEEKAREIRFGDAGPVNMETAEGSYMWPDLKQYKEMSLTTEHPIPVMANRDHCIEIYYNALRGYDTGELARRVGFDGKIDSFDVLEVLPVVYRTTNLSNGKIFRLESGDISIADAVRSAEKVLSELELSPFDLPFEPAVQSVNVLDIGDGCCAFCFDIVTKYKQVKFNALEMDASTSTVQTLFDSTHQIDMGGEAIMFKADRITRYGMVSPFAIADVAETNTYHSVIPFEKAAEIVSEHYTQGIKFKALSATAVYKRFSEERSHYASDDEYQHRKITVKPCWRFVLQPTTGNTKKLHYVYADMITGQSYSCVQVMNSDVGYDV